MDRYTKKNSNLSYVYIMSIILLLLIGCGEDNSRRANSNLNNDNSSLQPGPAPPFNDPFPDNGASTTLCQYFFADITELESARYSFTHNFVTNIIAVTTGQYSIDLLGMPFTITENGQNKSAGVIKDECTLHDSPSITAIVKSLLIYKYLWLPANSTPYLKEVAVNTLEWLFVCNKSEQILLNNIKYNVEKCTLTPPDGKFPLIQSVDRYLKVNDQQSPNEPFRGLIKQDVYLSDGTISTIELMKWNNL